MKWLLRLFRRMSSERDLDKELRFHLDEQTRDNMARGMNEAEAERGPASSSERRRQSRSNAGRPEEAHGLRICYGTCESPAGVYERSLASGWLH